MRDLFGKVRTLPNTTRDPDEPGLAAFDRVRITLKDGRELVSDSVRSIEELMAAVKPATARHASDNFRCTPHSARTASIASRTK